MIKTVVVDGKEQPETCGDGAHVILMGRRSGDLFARCECGAWCGKDKGRTVNGETLDRWFYRLEPLSREGVCARREQLNAEITAAVRAFEARTGQEVGAVHVMRSRTISPSSHNLPIVRTHIELGD